MYGFILHQMLIPFSQNIMHTDLSIPFSCTYTLQWVSLHNLLFVIIFFVENVLFK